MPAVGYARRLADVPRALAALRHHPEGLPLDLLASELGVPVARLREDLLAWFSADVVEGGPDSALVGFREPALEFLGIDGTEADLGEGPEAAEVVRIVEREPLAELGLAYLGPEVLGPLYRAARDLLSVEPDNEHLAEAVTRLEASVLPGVEGDLRFGGRTAALLRDAARDLRRVRLVYARSWRPGTVERVVEPYRVLSTRRGFEVDAGPAGGPAGVRTYLVSGIREVEVLDERFERPALVADWLAEARRPTTVELVVPLERRWVVERFAEQVAVLSADDDLLVRAELLPPVADRLGLLLTVAGPGAFVVEPAPLRDAGARAARSLLAHHGLA